MKSFIITPIEEMHGCFNISTVAYEQLEIIAMGLAGVELMPVGPKENATSAAYRDLAKSLRMEIINALVDNDRMSRGGAGVPTGPGTVIR